MDFGWQESRDLRLEVRMVRLLNVLLQTYSQCVMYLMTVGSFKEAASRSVERKF